MLRNSCHSLYPIPLLPVSITTTAGFLRGQEGFMRGWNQAKWLPVAVVVIFTSPSEDHYSPSIELSQECMCPYYLMTRTGFTWTLRYTKEFKWIWTVRMCNHTPFPKVCATGRPCVLLHVLRRWTRTSYNGWGRDGCGGIEWGMWHTGPSGMMRDTHRNLSISCQESYMSQNYHEVLRSPSSKLSLFTQGQTKHWITPHRDSGFFTSQTNSKGFLSPPFILSITY